MIWRRHQIIQDNKYLQQQSTVVKHCGRFLADGLESTGRVVCGGVWRSATGTVYAHFGPTYLAFISGRKVKMFVRAFYFLLEENSSSWRRTSTVPEFQVRTETAAAICHDCHRAYLPP